ncbi:MAG: sulfatase-like hydrolase/transferase [Oscillospiraceae bacterium]|jgi:arylsulfatase A-like enzyme|nr:sulfatase-like hydrolase/transferase [Oscillospiraceae bacterium]
MAKPNILIINPDQMRADSLRHLGNRAAHTPALDALAGEGVSFSQAFCQNPVCVPSRCSFMTGLYPHVHGHRTMNFLQQPHEENLFGDMKRGGYRTYSSHRGDLMAGQYPRYHKALVDEYIRVHSKRPLHHYLPPRGEPGSEGYYSFLNGIVPEKYATDMDDLIVDGAAQAIRRRPKKKPFFMFVGLMLPHPPYQIEQKYYDLIDKSQLPSRIPTIDDQDGKPKMERGLRDALGVSDWDEARLDEIRATYLAMCAKVDNQVGRLIQTLKDEGIYDDTAILVFSDHGDYTGDYGIVEKSQNCFPDCLTNVPFVLKPPVGVRVDRGVNDNLVELTDVCATAAELAGITIDRPHFSRSLLPTVADKTAEHRPFVLCEGGRLRGETHCMEYDPRDHRPEDHYAPRLALQGREDGTHTKAVMLRTREYKYIRRLEEPDEFYVLRQGERVNRMDEPAWAAQIAQAKEQLLTAMIATSDVVPFQLDSRFSLEVIKNGIRAAKAPGFLGDLLGVFLKLTRQSPAQFLRNIALLAQRVKGKKRK